MATFDFFSGIFRVASDLRTADFEKLFSIEVFLSCGVKLRSILQWEYVSGGENQLATGFRIRGEGQCSPIMGNGKFGVHSNKPSTLSQSILL